MPSAKEDPNQEALEAAKEDVGRPKPRIWELLDPFQPSKAPNSLVDEWDKHMEASSSSSPRFLVET